MTDDRYKKWDGRKRRPLWNTYRCMIARCHDPKNKSFCRYGAKGVKVCKRWRDSYENFVDDMGPRPIGMTLDRIDGSKGYSMSNCKWSTVTEQNRNRGSYMKLTMADARRIRALRGSNTKLASMFGVTRQHIASVRDGTIWKEA